MNKFVKDRRISSGVYIVAPATKNDSDGQALNVRQARKTFQVDLSISEKVVKSPDPHPHAYIHTWGY